MLQQNSRNYGLLKTGVIGTFPAVYAEYIKHGGSAPGIVGTHDKSSFLTISRLGSPTDLTFSEQASSYSFLAINPIHPNEQKKFNDTVAEADEDFGKIPTEATKVKLLCTMINQSIDLSRAKAWVESEFANGQLKNLDGVMILRSQPTQEFPGLAQSSSVVTTEFCFIFNYRGKDPNSVGPTEFGGPFKLVMPIGKASNQPTNMEMLIGTQKINLDGHYVHFVGEHYYKKSDLGTINLMSHPNITVHVDWDIQGKTVRITPRHKNRNKFILI